MMAILPGSAPTNATGDFIDGAPMTVHQSVLELIGRTPMVRA